MARLRVFEIHTHKAGAWKIDSVYDDRELAINEAKRVYRSGRWESVRVVEETLDEETGLGGSRTVYRAPTEASAEAPDTADAGSRQEQALARRARRAKAAGSQHKKKSMVGPFVLRTVLLALILGVALVLLYILNTSL
ncbi:MAG: hypothetical protein R3229_10470 [Alphaproteobacteria bacterium]|nr:hypothetical protein [Alphaproteobacteria bacterium]